MLQFPSHDAFTDKAIEGLSLSGLKHLGSGKVRELFSWNEDYLVFVATDRLSAFDVVMGEGIRKRGNFDANECVLVRTSRELCGVTQGNSRTGAAGLERLSLGAPRAKIPHNVRPEGRAACI